VIRLAALVLLLDNSGPSAAESPIVAFATVSTPGIDGRARAGVLDARTGRVLWSADFAGGVNDARTSVHGNLLAVLLNSRKEGYACHVFELATGRLRFRTEGAACVELPSRGLRFLGFPARDRMRVLDPATGLEAWSAPVTRHSLLTLTAGLLVAEGPRHVAAYALDDGRPAWEREKSDSDRLRVSGGRIWNLKPGEPRLVELDPSTGRDRTALDLPGPLVALAPHPEFVDLVLEREVRRVRGRDLGLEWAAPLPEPAVRALGDGRSIVVSAGPDGDRTILLDGSTGRVLSNQPVSRFARCEQSLRHPGYVVQSVGVLERASMLHVFDRRDGRLAWWGAVEEFEDAGRDALLVRQEGRLLLVDLTTRTERWSRPLDGAWKDTARRGDLLIVGTAASIAGLQASTGQQVWKLDAGPSAEVHFSGKR
jgi:outer membrane protein assembly factor BamB